MMQIRRNEKIFFDSIYKIMPPTSALASSRKASAYRIKSHTSVWVFGINPAMGFTRLELVVVIFVVAILAF